MNDVKSDEVLVMERAKAPIYLFEDISVDVNRFKVEREGHPVDLEPKALRVLFHLIEHRERVVPKDELIAEVWQGTFVTDNAVTRVIAQIRKQLGDQARSPRIIETATTAGYRFIADVKEGGAAEGSMALPSASARPLATIGLALAILAISMWWTRRVPASAGSPLQRIEQITSSAAADLWPSYSPDGNSLAFSSNRTGHFELYIRSLAEGGADRQITADGRDNIEPAWSPDGRNLAFVAKVRGGIGLIPIAGGPIRYLTDSGSEPQWSPNGKTLVYRSTNMKTVREAAGSWNSYLLLTDLDGSLPRRLTTPGTPRGGHNYPRWLPDGRHVIFSAPNEHASAAPWIVDTVTGSVDRVAEMSMNTVAYPTFTKDSSYLYFVGGGRREPMGLWRARVGRGWTTQRPEAVSPATVAWPRDLAMSPDGAHIASSMAIASRSEMYSSSFGIDGGRGSLRASIQVLESGIMVGDVFDLTCPHCSRKFQETTKRLLNNLSATCPGCGGEIDIQFNDEHGLETTTEVGPLQTKQGARGSVSFSVEVYNRGLNKHRLIRGPDIEVVKQKVLCQVAEWNEMWAKKAAAMRQATMAERKMEEAADRTSEAQQAIQGIRGVLSHSLSDSKAVDWESLKDRSPFPKPAPGTPICPVRPEQCPVPQAPSRTSPQYQAKLGLLDKLIASRRTEKENLIAHSFELDTREWEANRDRIIADHAANLEAYNTQLANLASAHSEALALWEAERAAFLSKQNERHEAIDAFRARYGAEGTCSDHEVLPSRAYKLRVP